MATNPDSEATKRNKATKWGSKGRQQRGNSLVPRRLAASDGAASGPGVRRSHEKLLLGTSGRVG